MFVALGRDASTVFKTLIVALDSGELVCAVIPSDALLNLKAIASAAVVTAVVITGMAGETMVWLTAATSMPSMSPMKINVLRLEPLSPISSPPIFHSLGQCAEHVGMQRRDHATTGRGEELQARGA